MGRALLRHVGRKGANEWIQGCCGLSLRGENQEGQPRDGNLLRLRKRRPSGYTSQNSFGDAERWKIDLSFNLIFGLSHRPKCRSDPYTA
jgi:hypothetical protein